nr:hypothetical protein [Tanacetum cinerariifolium]
MGKAKMVKEHVKPKKKEQIRLDDEFTLKLQAEFVDEERLARGRAQKEQEANIHLIETWDDVQRKIDVDYQLAERLQEQEQESFLMLKRLYYLCNSWRKEESSLQLRDQKRKGTNHQHKLNKERSCVLTSRMLKEQQVF